MVTCFNYKHLENSRNFVRLFLFSFIRRHSGAYFIPWKLFLKFIWKWLLYNFFGIQYVSGFRLEASHVLNFLHAFFARNHTTNTYGILKIKICTLYLHFMWARNINKLVRINICSYFFKHNYRKMKHRERSSEFVRPWWRRQRVLNDL